LADATGGGDEPAQRVTQFTCFCDNIVFSAVSGTLPDAENLHVPGTAHVQMAFQPTVFNEVLRWLQAPTNLPTKKLRTSAVAAR
jgi:type II secretory pathway component PulM